MSRFNSEIQSPSLQSCEKPNKPPKNAESRRQDHEPIAIIGMAFRFPQADNAATFWRNLAVGHDCIRELSPARWSLEKHFSRDIASRNKSVSKWCGSLDDIDRFDHDFFGISAREAKHIDPQQRMLLEQAWRCVEDAGVGLEALQHASTGVYVGAMSTDYQQAAAHPGRAVERFSVLGSYDCILANRVSYHLGLSGPSFSIGAACASSLVALHAGKQALQNREVDFALAGCAALNLHPMKYISFSKARMLSPDGRCRTFDKAANGYVPGEGVAMLLLQRLEDAVRDNHPIYGQLLGSAVNHVGQPRTITSPSVQAQKNLINQALADAAIPPGSVSYVEAHGTGTSLGDPIEVEALQQVFRPHAQPGAIALGSVKSNMGHLEASAGIAGVIKLLLMMQHRHIPKTLHVTHPNPVLDLSHGPLSLALTHQPWQPAGEQVLRGGVSSFGFGGVSAHAILEEAPPLEPVVSKQGPFPILLSAKSEPALHKLIAHWRQFLDSEDQDSLTLSDIATTLIHGRQDFPNRWGAWVNDFTELKQAFSQNTFKASEPKQQWQLHVDQSQLAVPTATWLKTNRDVYQRSWQSLQQDLDSKLVTIWENPKANTKKQRLEKQFMAAALLLRMLEIQGFVPNVISASGTGIWLALAHCGILDYTAALAGLRGRLSPEKMSFKRPRIPFADPLTQRVFRPFRVPSHYFPHLFEQVSCHPDELLDLAQKGSELFAVQHTFKRLLKPWDSALAKAQLNLTYWLENAEVVATLPPKHQLSFAMAVEVSSQQLYRKWELERPLFGKDPLYQELVALVTGGFLSPQQLIEGLLHQPHETHHLNLEQSLVTSGRAREFPTLVAMQTGFSEIADHAAWLRDCLAASPAASESCFQFLRKHQDPSTPIATIPADQVFGDALATTVLQLWQAGASIDWSSWIPKDAGRRIPLPTHPFLGSTFWLDPPQEMLPSPQVQEVMEPLGTKLSSRSELEQKPIEDAVQRAQLLVPRWEPLTSQTLSSAKENWLLWVADSASAKLAKTVFNPKQAIFQVVPGKKFKKLMDGTWELPFQQEYAWRQLFADPAFEGAGAILYTLPATADARDLALGSALNKLVKPFFWMAKAWALAQKQAETRWIVTTHKATACQPGDACENAPGAALWGLLQSLSKESKSVKPCMVDLDQVATASDDLWEQVLAHATPDSFLAMRQRQFWQRRFDLQNLTTPAKASLRQGGHYVLAGGAGGIGSVLATDLAENFQAKLTILGTRRLDEKRADLLETWAQKGAEVHYATLDIAHPEDVQHAVQIAVQKQGPIHGVFHAAGCLEDGLLAEKSWSSFARVLAPKVQGTMALDQATSSQPLDFFVTFSSVVGLLGNGGQADYATANAFQDAYMHGRKAAGHPGKSLSLNWTLWADGGMGQQHFIAKQFNKTTGVIHSDSALPCLRTALNLATPQAVIVGKTEPFFKTALPKPQVASTNRDLDPQALVSQLVPLLAAVIGADGPSLSAETPFRDLGLDSVGLMEFADTINTRFDVDVNATAFFECPTLHTLAIYMLKHFAHIAQAKAPEPNADPQTTEPTIGPSSLAPLAEWLASQLQISVQDVLATSSLEECGLDGHGYHQFAAFLRNTYGLEISATALAGYDSLAEISALLPHQQEKTPPTPQPTEQTPTREPRRDQDPIAIVGMSGRFPQSDDLDSFWENLCAGKDMVGEIPAQRWDWRAYHGDPHGEANLSACKWGGFIKDPTRFDADFFKISPREAMVMDPQQRLMLEEVWRAIEDAGIAPLDLAETATGMYIGVCNADYNELLVATDMRLDGFRTTGAYYSMIPNRISYALNLQGPSVAIDTACSSSLVALHQAVQGIRNGDCDMAVVGGVNLCLSPKLYISLSHAGMLSPAGRCKTFDASADGYVRSDGAAAVFLKPLSAALRDGNPVHGLIKATAVNHGGKAHSLTAPNPQAQSQLLLKAYRQAEVCPSTIGYIEAHGTGTSLGDPIEFNALCSAFETLYDEGSIHPKDALPIALGSVKSNMGHAESAAGIAGIIKVLLAMRHGKIPGNLHLNSPNPYLKWQNSPFVFQAETNPWKPRLDQEIGQAVRRAGVSSFGFGGVNGHVVLESFSRPKATPTIHPPDAMLFVLSAKNKPRLKAYAEKWLAWANTPQGKHLLTNELRAVCATLQMGREPMSTRLGFVCRSAKDVRECLQLFIEGGVSPKLSTGDLNETQPVTSSLLNGQEGQDFLRALKKNRRLPKLLQLWVSGMALDWQQLSDTQHVTKLSLPTYPFAETSFWLPKSSTPVAIERNPGNQTPPRVRLLRDAWIPSNRIPQPRSLPDKGLILASKATQSFAQQLQQSLPFQTQLLLCLPEGVPLEGKLPDLSAEDLPEIIVDTCDLAPAKHDPQQDFPRWAWIAQLIRQALPQPPSFIHLTQHRNPTSGNTANLNGSLSAGFLKTLGWEYKQWHVATIDADFEAQANQSWTGLILQEWQHRQSGSYRYNQGIRHERQFEDVEPSVTTPHRLKPNDGWVLITGGVRGLGLAVAQDLAGRGWQKLALCGFRKLPKASEWSSLMEKPQTSEGLKQQLSAFKTLETMGVTLKIFSGAGLDSQAFQEFFKTTKAQWGSLTGVFHAAGAVSHQKPAFIEKTRRDMAPIFAPKVQGLQAIARLVGEEKLRFFVVFSSVASAIPSLGAGISDYAAANSYMDDWVTAMRAAGKTYCQSIHWPSWKGLGMGEITTSAYKQSGLLTQDRNSGLAMLDMVLDHGEMSHVLPCLTQPQFNPAQLLNPPAAPAVVHPHAAEPLGQNRDAPIHSEETVTLSFLETLLVEALGIDSTQIKPDTPFANLGVDSILLASLVHRIEKWLGQDVSPSAVLEHPSLKQLTTYLVKTYQAPIAGKLPQQTQAHPPVNPDLAEIVMQEKQPRQPLIQGPTRENDTRIAVVGMACRVPGAEDQGQFWRNLREGVCSIGEVPRTRWDTQALYRETYQPGKSISKWGGFLGDIELFDPDYFGIDEATAKQLDPLVREYLQTGVQAFRHAGYATEELAGKQIGVFVGSRTANFANLVQNHHKQTIVGIGQNFIAAHLSHFFDLKGPALVVDTACSSSLVSIHLACQSLLTGESSMALAGGVDLLLDETPYLMLSEGRALSPDGKCHTFDHKANGFVPGEGSGAVVLKTLDAAMADGDQIFAVIEATAVNNDGKTMGITTPNPEAQYDVIRQALAQAKIDPRSMTYMEAHGTGTMIGDPIELKALTRLFRESTRDTGFCAVGSVKTNIGHLLSAAGIAGALKVILSLHHRYLPPTLHCETPNPRFAFDASPFVPNVKGKTWQGHGGVRRAGISSFGFGGTNAHLIFADAPAHTPRRAPLAPANFQRQRFWPEPISTSASKPAPASDETRLRQPDLLELIDEVATF